MKLFEIGENGQSVDKSAEEIAFISADISHSKFDFAECKIHVLDKLLQNKYYALMLNENYVFIGKVAEIHDDNKYLLQSKPIDYTDQKSVIEKLNNSSYIFSSRNLKLKPLIMTRATDMRLTCWNESTVTWSILLDEAYGYSISEKPESSGLKVIINTESVYYKDDIVDFSHLIFPEGGLKTLTPEAVVADWPEIFSKYHDFYVIDSSISQKSNELVELNDGNFMNLSTLYGSLVLQRIVPVVHNEKWELIIDNYTNTSNTINLYLDLSKYFSMLKSWKSNTDYFVGDIIKFQLGQEHFIKICNKKHNSVDHKDEYWDSYDDVSYYELNDQYLFDSYLGNLIFKGLVEYILAYKIYETPTKTISIDLPFEKYPDVDIGDWININEEGKFLIVKYYKTYNALQATLHIEAHQYNPEQEADPYKQHELFNLITKPSYNNSVQSKIYHDVKVQNPYTDQLEEVKQTKIDLFVSNGSIQIKNEVKIKVNLKEIK